MGRMTRMPWHVCVYVVAFPRAFFSPVKHGRARAVLEVNVLLKPGETRTWDQHRGIGGGASRGSHGTPFWNRLLLWMSCNDRIDMVKGYGSREAQWTPASRPLPLDLVSFYLSWVIGFIDFPSGQSSLEHRRGGMTCRWTSSHAKDNKPRPCYL